MVRLSFNTTDVINVNGQPKYTDSFQINLDNAIKDKNYVELDIDHQCTLMGFPPVHHQAIEYLLSRNYKLFNKEVSNGRLIFVFVKKM